MYTTIGMIDGCYLKEVVQVRHFQDMHGEINGLDATARLRVEKLEEPNGGPRPANMATSFNPK